MSEKARKNSLEIQASTGDEEETCKQQRQLQFRVLGLLSGGKGVVHMIGCHCRVVGDCLT